MEQLTKMTTLLTQVKGARTGPMVDIFKIAMSGIQYHSLLSYFSIFATLELSPSCYMIFFKFYNSGDHYNFTLTILIYKFMNA